MKVISIQQYARDTSSRLRMRKRNRNWILNHMGWGNLLGIGLNCTGEGLDQGNNKAWIGTAQGLCCAAGRLRRRLEVVAAGCAGLHRGWLLAAQGLARGSRIVCTEAAQRLVGAAQGLRRRLEVVTVWAAQRCGWWLRRWGLRWGSVGGCWATAQGAFAGAPPMVPWRILMRLQVGGDNELSLLLPLNASHTGLKRILVGEGITGEVRNAQGVSLDHALELALQVNRSVAIDRQGSEFWPFQNSLCETLLPICISGSVTVAAYRARNPDSYIETTFLLRDTIEWLSEKCYLRNVYRKRRCPIDSINLRTAAIEKLLRSFLGDKIYQNGGLGFLKANIKASTVVRFKMELERDIRSNDTLQGTLAEWRTGHTIERVWFELVARIERERLKPLVVKKVIPSTEVDSSGWSNLMSNISFTKFPSILVPPEALTLDVKW
ncbi:hypothetical protein Acr_05g0005500 [Actinidia rufa]|uniref:Uncharacterized protein n=1 Tax=Actinidia rufa TaxID=165716 RepID=A0A7J0EKB1_9ERIC|nr:hypothetical protein Acr_05g0005500 [Actinidia rufa]